jgi:hypothetical protein
MSIIISIRLDPTNSRESMAIKVLENWNKKGYSKRNTIVEALLTLNHDQTNELIDEMNRIEGLLLDLLNYSIEKKSDMGKPSGEVKLSISFIETLKSNIRPGING